MDARDAYIEQLEKTIKNLQDQVSNLTEMVMLLRKEKFGPSSEKAAKSSEEQLQNPARNSCLFLMSLKSKQMVPSLNQSLSLSKDTLEKRQEQNGKNY